MEQKARMGGTPGKAPVGYLNVREIGVDGFEYRTIAIDENKAPDVQWAFRAYAAGLHSIEEMTDALESRGLTSKPHRRGGRPKPMAVSAVGRMLRNPYYIGKVVYKGEVFDGNHEPLISLQLFDQVQELLTAKNTSGSRRRVHRHPLKGMLTCEHCKGRVYMTKAKNRHGSVYSYFFCRGRQKGVCEVPYLSVDQIVEKVYALHELESEITAEQLKTLDAWVADGIEEMSKGQKTAAVQAEKDLERSKRQRDKLLRLYYDEDIDRDTFRTEQQRLDDTERAARLRLAETATGLEEVGRRVSKTAALLQSWPERMRSAKPETQDRFHDAFYETFGISLGDDDSGAVVTAEPREHTKILKQTLTRIAEVLAKNENEPEKAAAFSGSNMSLLVPRTGFEPVLPA